MATSGLRAPAFGAAGEGADEGAGGVAMAAGSAGWLLTAHGGTESGAWEA